MVIIQRKPPPPFYEVREPKSNAGSGIREPGYERTQCWKGIVRHARQAAALVQGDCFGAAPLAMTTWVSDPGSRIPYPGSRIFRYAHDLSNLRITQQIVDLLCREGL